MFVCANSHSQYCFCFVNFDCRFIFQCSLYFLWESHVAWGCGSSLVMVCICFCKVSSCRPIFLLISQPQIVWVIQMWASNPYEVSALGDFFLYQSLGRAERLLMLVVFFFFLPLFPLSLCVSFFFGKFFQPCFMQGPWFCFLNY